MQTNASPIISDSRHIEQRRADSLNCLAIRQAQTFDDHDIENQISLAKGRAPFCVNREITSLRHGPFVPVRTIKLYSRREDFRVRQINLRSHYMRPACGSVYQKSHKLIPVATSNREFAVVRCFGGCSQSMDTCFYVKRWPPFREMDFIVSI